MQTFRPLFSVVALVIACALVLPTPPLLAQTAPQSKIQNPPPKIEPPSLEQQEMDRLDQEGMQAYRKGQFPEALKAWQRCLEIAQRLNNEQNIATYLNNIGLIYVSLSQYEKALDYLQRALILREKIGNPQDISTSLNNIAVVYASTSQYEKALEYAQRSLVIREKIGNPQDISGSLNTIGGVYASLGQYQRALDYFQRALVLIEKIGNPEAISASLNNMGGMYGYLGQHEKALECLQRALALYEKTGNPQDISMSLTNIGNIYDSTGQFEKALEYHQRALTLREKIDNPEDISASLHNIGNVYWSMGQQEKALEYQQRALAIREKTNNPEDISASLNDIGIVYNSLGQYGKALEYYQQALAIKEKIGNPQDISRSLNNIGGIYTFLGQFDKALEYHQRSLALREKIGNPQDIGGSLNNIGFVYDNLAQYAKALEYYQRALALFEKIGNPRNIGGCLTNIGNIYDEFAQYEKALDYHLRALALREKIGNPREICSSLYNIGLVYQSLRQYEKTEAAFTRGKHLFEQLSRDVLADPTQLGDLLATTFLYQNYALFLIDRKRPEDALNLLESGRVRGVALQLAASKASLARFFTAEEAAQLGVLKTEAVLTAKSFAAIKARLIPRDEAERNAFMLQQKEAETKANAAFDRYELYRSTLTLKHPQFKLMQGERIHTAMEFKHLSARHPDTLYLEFAVGKKSLLLALHKGVLTAKTLPMTNKKVWEIVGKWREAMEHRTGDEPKRAQELYTALLQPVQSKIQNPKSKIKRLVVVADGALHDLPFAALRDKQGKRLVERFAVSNALSLGILLWDKNPKTPTQGLLCIADTRTVTPKQITSLSRGGFGALPAAQEEGRTIAELYPNVSLLVGNQAREAKVKQEMSKYALLHFAAHGDLDTKNGLRSALVLAEEPPNSPNDGFLDGREIIETGVSAKLAVLSACNSGQGKKSGGEGLMGLVWAFRAAGCPSVVASQWKVDDAATKELMVKFYQGLKAKLPKDEALREAMLLVKKTKPQPYYWAAFQIIGETTPLPRSF